MAKSVVKRPVMRGFASLVLGVAAFCGLGADAVAPVSREIIVTGAAVGVNQIADPTVVAASVGVRHPLGRFYMWAAPHDGVEGAGVFLFVANAVGGPWQPANGGRPVLTSGEYGSKSHIGSPWVVYDPRSGRLIMWAHIGGFPASSVGGTQRTYAWSSDDGVNWRPLNGGRWVLGSSVSGDDSKYAAYLSVAVTERGFIGWYQAATGGTRERRTLMRATSVDGIHWQKHGEISDGSNLNNPMVSIGRDGESVCYVKLSASKDIRCRLWFDRSGRAGPEYLMSIRQSPEDYGRKAVPSDLLYADGRMWLFYTDNIGGVTVGDAIGVSEVGVDKPFGGARGGGKF